MSRIDYKKLLNEITMSWFYKKPVLFSLVNKFEICENNNLVTCFRSGRKKIEYNSSLLNDCTYGKIKGLLELELYRNALNHPNRRKPEFCDDLLWYQASSMAISPTYASKCGFPPYRTIEEYYRLLTEEPEEQNNDQNEEEQQQQGNPSNGNEFQKILDDTIASGDFDNAEEDGFNPEDFQMDDESGNSQEDTESDGDQNLEENSEDDDGNPVSAWSEDLIESKEIQNFVEEKEVELSYSPIGTSLSNQILQLKQKQKLKTSFDLARFFAQKVARGKRKLSRMKPNRRSGFEQMGYMHGTKTKLLVCIDTSASVATYFIDIYYAMLKSLSKIINEIYVFQIDTQLQTAKPVKYNSKLRQVSVKGRGGTEFNPLFEYLKKHRREYDGLIVFTDGFFSPPRINLYRDFNFKTLWVINSKAENYHWYHNYGEVTYIR